MLIEYYKDTDVTVSWDYVNKWVYVRWENMPATETVKIGCDAMLKLLKLKNASLVLNDNTHINGPWSGASKWVSNEWFPAMIAAGLKKFAWIKSSYSALSNMSAKSSSNAAKEVIKMFDHKSEAEIWLKNFSQSSRDSQGSLLHRQI